MSDYFTDLINEKLDPIVYDRLGQTAWYLADEDATAQEIKGMFYQSYDEVGFNDGYSGSATITRPAFQYRHSQVTMKKRGYLDHNGIRYRVVGIEEVSTHQNSVAILESHGVATNLESSS